MGVVEAQREFEIVCCELVFVLHTDDLLYSAGAVVGKVESELVRGSLASPTEMLAGLSVGLSSAPSLKRNTRSR